MSVSPLSSAAARERLRVMAARVLVAHQRGWCRLCGVEGCRVRAAAVALLARIVPDAGPPVSGSVKAAGAESQPS